MMKKISWDSKNGIYIVDINKKIVLIITQLLFQQNAQFFVLLKAQNITIFVLFVFVFLAPTCFNPRGSSSGGAMPVPS
jgi:hypothetical protein